MKEGVVLHIPLCFFEHVRCFSVLDFHRNRRLRHLIPPLIPHTCLHELPCVYLTDTLRRACQHNITLLKRHDFADIAQYPRDAEDHQARTGILSDSRWAWLCVAYFGGSLDGFRGEPQGDVVGIEDPRGETGAEIGMKVSKPFAIDHGRPFRFASSWTFR